MISEEETRDSRHWELGTSLLLGSLDWRHQRQNGQIGAPMEGDEGTRGPSPLDGKKQGRNVASLLSWLSCPSLGCLQLWQVPCSLSMT